MRRTLISLGLSIILILNTSYLASAAGKTTQEIKIRYETRGEYTIYIPTKVQFTSEEIKSSYRYVSKPINIAIANNNFALERMKVRISDTNTFKLIRKDGKYIDFFICDKKLDENNLEYNQLSKGDYIEIGDANSISDWRAFFEWLIKIIFGVVPKGSKYGQCFAVIDKNAIHDAGEYNGNLTFEFGI